MEKIVKNPCIAMIPCPGLSHLIPHIEFAKRLVRLHPEFHVFLLIPTLGSPSATTHSLLKSLPPHIHFSFLPQVNMQDLPPDAMINPASQMHLTVTHSLPSISQALASLASQSHLVALVVDLFSVDALQIGKEFNLSSFVHFASSAANLSFCLYLPKLDEILSSSSGDLLSDQPVKLPGSSTPLHAKDLPDLVHDRSSPYYKTMLHICKQIHSADGITVNSFQHIEPDVIRALQVMNENLPVYPVGPIIQTGTTTTSSAKENGCLAWLDKQPKKSVLYVCFGSGGSLSYEQTTELALGLEMSGHRFLWLVRPPSGSAISTYLSAQNDDDDDPYKFLPNGFVDRIKGRGFLVHSWCPQVEVLSHESTGGFLTHCGWNSTLESLVYGKPTIAWPLFADQPVNAVMLTHALKVAVRPNSDEKDGMVKREEVSRVVKCVLEGDGSREMYERVQVIKDAAAKALSKDGSSTKALEAVALKWKPI